MFDDRSALASIAEKLLHAHEYKTLLLAKNNINDAMIRPLCQFLKNHPGIDTLILNDNNIGDKGVTELCRFLQSNENNIKRITLKNNPITGVGSLSCAYLKFLNPNLLIEYDPPKLIESNYKLTNLHNLICKFLKLMDHHSDSGLCYGLSHLVMQASLIDEYEIQVFNDRLQLIYVLMIKAIYDASQENKNITPGKEFDDLIAVNLKKQINNVSVNRRVDIRAFGDSIEIIHNTSDYAYLFPKDSRVLVQDAPLGFSLIQSKLLDCMGKIEKVFAFSGVYSQAEIKKYLISLRNIIDRKGLNNAIKIFPIVLSNADHCMYIGYLPGKKGWLFFNANRMPVKYIYNDDTMAENIFRAFNIRTQSKEIQPSVIMSSEIYSLKNIKKEASSSKLFASNPGPDSDIAIMNVINEWVKSEDWQQIHAITKPKSQVLDAHKNTWLNMAIRLEDVETVKKLLENGADPNNEYLRMPLFQAVAYKNLEITKMLLSYGADPYKPNKYNETALDFAVRKHYTDFVSVIENSRALIPYPK